ncbi:MAG: oxygen-independent coproporphyrinogen III oxidase [Sphingobacteriaceae bacterium]|nr:MAG: oxygen-independent coproporphyrinogen III oxidase [Sphingobacteriaceae bacterium]
MSKRLIEKYNVPAPRYTSYPTVPYWNDAPFDIKEWEQSVNLSFKESNAANGISIYIHLPYCESLCTYCGCNTRITKSHKVEEPYIQAVLKEWAIYRRVFESRPVIKEIHLGGGTPTFFKPENLELLINGILANAIIHPDAEFSFEAHPGNTTEAHLVALYNLGFRRLSLGIQDFDPKVQFIINRVQSFEQVKTVTDAARQIGYTSVNFDLIYGLPLQTIESIVDTVEKVSALMPERIAFYSYAHVPWVKPGQRRYKDSDIPGTHLKQELYNTGRNLLTALGYKEIGMDHFTLPTDSLCKAEKEGTLHRNFMGYTHQHTQLLVGLGVSSISDSWYGYAQNAKTVEDYLAQFNSGVLPVVKFHKLTDEDLLLRRHILNMMCTGKTCWNHHMHNSTGLLQAVERLQPLADDGLVNLNSWCVEVTPLGKRFLRNICMAFDARLWAKKPGTQLFSMAG